MQTRSYRNRQSGNLVRKVRNADPGSTALKIFLNFSGIYNILFLVSHGVTDYIANSDQTIQ